MSLAVSVAYFTRAEPTVADLHSCNRYDMHNYRSEGT